jgi:hypothetical protein
VPRPAQNMIPLHAKSALHARAEADDLPVSVRRLGVAIQELDDLRRCAETTIRDPKWSAMEWRAASSSLLLRLAKAGQSLAELECIRVGRWPDTGWAATLRAECSEVKRRLMDIGISLSVLADEETSSRDAVVTFTSDAMLLAEAVDELCGLIITRYPATVDGEI